MGIGAGPGAREKQNENADLQAWCQLRLPGPGSQSLVT